MPSMCFCRVFSAKLQYVTNLMTKPNRIIAVNPVSAATCDANYRSIQYNFTTSPKINSLSYK